MSSQVTGLHHMTARIDTDANRAFGSKCGLLCLARSGMGKTAVFVLACLQQIDSSEKAIQGKTCA